MFFPFWQAQKTGKPSLDFCQILSSRMLGEIIHIVFGDIHVLPTIGRVLPELVLAGSSDWRDISMIGQRGHSQ